MATTHRRTPNTPQSKSRASAGTRKRVLGKKGEASHSNVRMLGDRYGLDLATLAECLGYSATTVAAWESGKKVPGQLAQKRISQLSEVLGTLAQIVSRERLPVWIHQSLSGFQGHSPLELLKEQRHEPLYRMVSVLESGDPL